MTTTAIQPRYPSAVITLTGVGQERFMLLGRVLAALRRAGARIDQITECGRAIVRANDWNAVLRVVMAWVRITVDETQSPERGSEL